MKTRRWLSMICLLNLFPCTICPQMMPVLQDRPRPKWVTLYSHLLHLPVSLADASPRLCIYAISSQRHRQSRLQGIERIHRRASAECRAPVSWPCPGRCIRLK
ncbi:hypothetical protein F4604DRAFT_764048 [Suillus subluteus]|nr:hypothetical protein F4604DRAFT_764048 [Suillus subluteus]